MLPYKIGIELMIRTVGTTTFTNGASTVTAITTGTSIVTVTDVVTCTLDVCQVHTPTPTTVYSEVFSTVTRTYTTTTCPRKSFDPAWTEVLDLLTWFSRYNYTHV